MLNPILDQADILIEQSGLLRSTALVLGCERQLQLRFELSLLTRFGFRLQAAPFLFRLALPLFFLTLSLLPKLRLDLGLVPGGVAHALNYGLDRVRFLNPVKAGARIRVRVMLLSITDKGAGRTLLKTQNTVEIEGEEKPALIAETLSLLIKG